jgi:hypothetical protein
MRPKNLDGKTAQELNGDTIERWENEGGATRSEAPDRQYGRRVEPDRTWTVYHVFTGNPAVVEDREMIGLTRSAATDGMLSLNRRKAGRPTYRGSRLANIGFGPLLNEDYWS